MENLLWAYITTSAYSDGLSFELDAISLVDADDKEYFEDWKLGLYQRVGNIENELIRKWHLGSNERDLLRRELEQQPDWIKTAPHPHCEFDHEPIPLDDLLRQWMKRRA